MIRYDILRLKYTKLDFRWGGKGKGREGATPIFWPSALSALRSTMYRPEYTTYF